jgi:hypothetical protein
MERREVLNNACIFDAGSSGMVFPLLGAAIVVMVEAT